MEQIEDVVLEVCDQLDETDAPAEVQIVTDDVAGKDAKEAGTIDDINKTLIEEEFLEKPEEAVIEINESSQLAQTLLEPDPEVAKEKIKELVPDSTDDFQQKEQKEEVPTGYAFFVLAVVTMVRTCFVVMKNSVGYAFGFEGLGFRAANPKYMLRAQFPELVPVFGLVASGLFGAAYCTTNIIMSSKSKNWDKKRMLSIALLGMSVAMFGNGSASTLGIFSLNRFLFGVFAAAINAPIYQMIAANFPPQYRSTANAIENSGYYLGAGFASVMVLAIKQFGWRSIYYISGGAGLLLLTLTQLFIKNPVIASDSTPKITEEDEDKMLKTIRINKDIP